MPHETKLQNAIVLWIRVRLEFNRSFFIFPIGKPVSLLQTISVGCGRFKRSWEAKMTKRQRGLWVTITLLAHLVGCASAGKAPTVAITIGPGRSPAAFADDSSACAAIANQKTAVAENASYGQIAGSTILSAAAGASNSAATGGHKGEVVASAALGAVAGAIVSVQAAHVTLQRHFDIAYANCLYAKGHIISGFAWVPGNIPNGSTSPASDLMELARGRLLGVWRGSYFCAQGETGVELSFTELHDDGVARGTFSFFSLPGRNNAPSGEFSFTGQLDISQQRLYLDPGPWITQPPGYVTVGLWLSFPQPQANQLTGIISAPSCNEIRTAKAGG